MKNKTVYKCGVCGKRRKKNWMKIKDGIKICTACYNKQKYCYEHCPNCDKDVRLKNVFKRQRCPSCNKLIKPCNICDMDKVDCSKCKLGGD